VDNACIAAFDPMWLGKETAAVATANCSKSLSKTLA
jgi:hypothetical protein